MPRTRAEREKIAAEALVYMKEIERHWTGSLTKKDKDKYQKELEDAVANIHDRSQDVVEEYHRKNKGVPGELSDISIKQDPKVAAAIRELDDLCDKIERAVANRGLINASARKQQDAIEKNLNIKFGSDGDGFPSIGAEDAHELLGDNYDEVLQSLFGDDVSGRKTEEDDGELHYEYLVKLNKNSSTDLFVIGCDVKLDNDGKIASINISALPTEKSSIDLRGYNALEIDGHFVQRLQESRYLKVDYTISDLSSCLFFRQITRRYAERKRQEQIDIDEQIKTWESRIKDPNTNGLVRLVCKMVYDAYKKIMNLKRDHISEKIGQATSVLTKLKDRAYKLNSRETTTSLSAIAGANMGCC